MSGSIPPEGPTRRLALRFGELTLVMQAAEPELGLVVPPEYQPFIGDADAAADCIFRWRIGPVAMPSNPPLVESLIWRAWDHADGGEEIIFVSGWGHPYLSVVFNADFSEAAVTRTADDVDPTAVN